MFIDELFQKYPYAVRIYQKKGTSYFVVQDGGRKVMFKDGTTALRLRREKVDIPFTDFTCMTLDEKGNHIIDYYSPAEGEFFPVELRENAKIMEKYPVDKDVLFWWVNDYARKQEKYRKEKDMWEKLLPMVLVGMIVIGIVITTIMNYDGLVKALGALSGIQQENAKVIAALAELQGVVSPAPVESTVTTAGGVTTITG